MPPGNSKCTPRTDNGTIDESDWTRPGARRTPNPAWWHAWFIAWTLTSDLHLPEHYQPKLCCASSDTANRNRTLPAMVVLDYKAMLMLYSILLLAAEIGVVAVTYTVIGRAKRRRLRLLGPFVVWSFGGAVGWLLLYYGAMWPQGGVMERIVRDDVWIRTPCIAGFAALMVVVPVMMQSLPGRSAKWCSTFFFHEYEEPRKSA